MSLYARTVFAVLWVLSLLLVGALVSAQTQPFRRDPGPIVSGADIGFRPDGWIGQARTGTFVVRINGEWVEVKDSMRQVPTTR